MRPTMFEVHCNVEFFAGLLEGAGVEGGSAKVNALAQHLIEYYQIKRYRDRSAADWLRYHQFIHRHPPKPNGHRTLEEEKVRLAKSIGVSRRMTLRYDQRLKALQTKIERKIANWPELTYNTAELRTQPLATDRRRRLANRSRRPRKFLDR